MEDSSDREDRVTWRRGGDRSGRKVVEHAAVDCTKPDSCCEKSGRFTSYSFLLHPERFFVVNKFPNPGSNHHAHPPTLSIFFYFHFFFPETVLTLLEPQPRFGDKPLKFQVVCPQNGTAVLKGLNNKECFTRTKPCGGKGGEAAIARVQPGRTSHARTGIREKRYPRLTTTHRGEMKSRLRPIARFCSGLAIQVMVGRVGLEVP